ncbi:MAG UNVERIFIED_CONTAM: hypothetical protein LVR29_31850 [Microcystis novacekii LVE1205-3]
MISPTGNNSSLIFFILATLTLISSLAENLLAIVCQLSSLVWANWEKNR